MIIYALIPLRTGSVRIKNKNFVKVKKKPVYFHAVNQTLKSKLIRKVFIATKSKKIKIKHKKLSIFKRSKKSNTKKSSTEIVIEEFLRSNFCDYLVLIQATNLFIKTKYIDLAINKIINNRKKYDSLLSVVKSKYLIWQRNKDIIISKNYNYKKRPRSQDIKDKEFIENGSFYIFSRKNFLKTKNRLHGKITYFEMPKESIFELDEKEDFKIIKQLI
jgi:CMP-N-acetylneuraminic acid synthetase|tara:strand:+ start:2648 stop:3298 length:651 start_codon:yes stop_codon:yes gene_type:complete